MRYFFLVTSAICAFSSFCNPIGGRVAARGIEYVEQDELPYDSDVEYLESTGMQYIDTGVQSQDGVTAYVELLRANRYSNECYLGGYGDSSSRLWLAYSFGNTWYRGYGNNQSSTGYEANINVITSIETILAQNSISWYVDGAFAYSILYSNVGFSSRVNVFMFAMSTGNGANYYAIGRIYCCKIYLHGELVRDFYPVRKHGVGYMYDNVTGELFGNQGVGSFIIGPDVH